MSLKQLMQKTFTDGGVNPASELYRDLVTPASRYNNNRWSLIAHIAQLVYYIRSAMSLSNDADPATKMQMRDQLKRLLYMMCGDIIMELQKHASKHAPKIFLFPMIYTIERLDHTRD